RLRVTTVRVARAAAARRNQAAAVLHPRRRRPLLLLPRSRTEARTRPAVLGRAGSTSRRTSAAADERRRHGRLLPGRNQADRSGGSLLPGRRLVRRQSGVRDGADPPSTWGTRRARRDVRHLGARVPALPCRPRAAGCGLAVPTRGASCLEPVPASAW